MINIIIATPHERHNNIVRNLTENLAGINVIRIYGVDDLAIEKLEQLAPDWIFFPHWSWIISSKVYEKYNCVIFHMTDLPYGRGGSPLQNLIVRKHKHTKISAIKCMQELDAGPIYVKRDLSLHGTAEEILDRASILIEEMIEWIVMKTPTPKDQIGDVVVFKRRKKDDGNLALISDLESIYDHIRMLDADGYPNAFIETQHMQLEFKCAKYSGEWIDACVRIRIRKYD
jgi:methionyl-tRNA formyltransferase